MLFDGFNVFALVDGARLNSALDTCGALLAGVGQRTQSGGGIGYDQAQHSVQFAVVRIDALAAESLEVLKDALDFEHAFVGSLYMHGVGSQIDANTKLVFHEP